MSDTFTELFFMGTSGKKVPNCVMWTMFTQQSVAEKRLRIDLASIKQMLENKEISKLSWVGANLQVSNCFTKRGADTGKLLRILEDGCLKLF